MDRDPVAGGGRGPLSNRFLRLLSVELLLVLGMAAAREWVIQPVPGQAVINRAIDSASPGDRIRLLPGVYREVVSVNKPLTLDGRDGAILDPSTELPSPWREATEIGEGVWKFPAPRKPEALLMNGKVVGEIVKAKALATGPWHWKTLLVNGLPQSGFTLMKGLFLWDPETMQVYAKIEAPGHPNHDWRLVERDLPTLAFANVTGATVLGLRIASGAVGVRFGRGAIDCVLRDSSVTGYESTGILLTDEASTCVVTSNFITRGALESYRSSYEGTDANRKPEYEIWKLHKERGNSDSVAVHLHRSGTSNRVLSNRLLLNFDGIDIGDYAVQYSLSDPLLHPDRGRGTEVAWNRIEDTKDSAVELGAGAIDVRIHHNHLLRSYGGFRFKIPRIGPVYVYQNLLEDDRRMNFWFSMDSSPAIGYVYHNTVIGRNTATAYWGFAKEPSPPVAARWHFLNNLFVTTNGLFTSQSVNQPVADFRSGHNLLASAGSGSSGLPAGDVGSKSLPNLPLDEAGRPDRSNPELLFGMDLGRFLDGAPLPGCEPGSFAGAVPPVGAFQMPGPAAFPGDLSPQVRFDPDEVASNRPFSVRLTVDRDFGFWSTNSPEGPYHRFGREGATVDLPTSRTVWTYSQAATGIAGGIRSRSYSIEPFAESAPPAPGRMRIRHAEIRLSPAEDRLVSRTTLEDLAGAGPVGWACCIAPRGTDGWVALSNLEGDSTPTNGTWTIAWRWPKSFPNARRVDVRLVALRGGSEPSLPFVLQDVDVTAFSRLPEDLSRVEALNNPWKGAGEGITFVHLTRNASVKIVDLSGRTVAELKTSNDGKGRATWPLVGGGWIAPPGVYLAVLSDPTGARRVMRLTVGKR